MELTNSFPPLDSLIVYGNKKIKEFDYVKFGDNVVEYTATTVAIVVGVVSYLYTAFQLWWVDNGETVQVNLIRFIVNLVDFIGAVAYGIPKVYRWVGLNTNRLIDSIYFQVSLA